MLIPENKAFLFITSSPFQFRPISPLEVRNAFLAF